MLITGRVSCPGSLAPRVAPKEAKKGYFFLLSLGALGVVFGDIGTSPLYAVREAFFGEYGVGASHDNVLGVLSLIFWSLIIIVTIKYLVFVLRADNEGEGGILALMSLIHPEHGGSGSPARKGIRRLILVSLGLFGAALLYGDGMITPAISVLSAVEGVELAAPALASFVVPMAVGVLILFFVMQKSGTGKVGRFFGPITLLWFLTLATLGVRGILQAPEVLSAVNPLYGVRFLLSNGFFGFFVLGAVFLVVTGSEALYADMGHFGKGPIRFTWFTVVLPALLLNYFGQGALVLTNPDAAHNPFFRLAPEWALIPLVILATLATIIASQAMVAGAFSITTQAVQLGYSPRVGIRYTSEHEMGQVYVPFVNWTLMVASVTLVIVAGSSTKLAAAYGIAVAATIIITSILFVVVARENWKWSLWAVIPLGVLLIGVELMFLAANAVKILAGGWFPLLVASIVFLLMTTWREGRRLLGARLAQTASPLEKFFEELQARPPTRVRGNAIYMTGSPRIAPPALVKNLEHNRVLHFQVVLMSIVTEDVPYVPGERRVTVEKYPNGFYRVVATYGFMEQPDAIEILRHMRDKGLNLRLNDTTFFLGRERLVPAGTHGMPIWRERIFAFMAMNAQQATAYFRIPPDRVIEVGASIEI